MPAGIENPILGYATFAAIKIAGYSAMANSINKNVEQNERQDIYKVGVARTVIGVVFGAIYWVTLLYAFNIDDSTTPVVYFTGLAMIRYFEWYLLIRYFYPVLISEQRHRPLVFKGMLVSYVLDLPASLGLIATAGILIC